MTKYGTDRRNESPLKTVTRSQSEKLDEVSATINSRIVVDWAMRYGNALIGSRLECFHGRVASAFWWADYPQYAAATTATVCDGSSSFGSMWWQPSLRVAPPYYDNPVYIEAVTDSHFKRSLKAIVHAAGLFLLHSMGRQGVSAARPTLIIVKCSKTARLLRENLKLNEATFLKHYVPVAFGKTEWLQPYTDVTVRNLAKAASRILR